MEVTAERKLLKDKTIAVDSTTLEANAAMKDKRTHLAYKAEHAVDVESGLLVAPVVYRATDAAAETLPATVELAREQLTAGGCTQHVDEVVGDKGYHKAETIPTLDEVQ